MRPIRLAAAAAVAAGLFVFIGRLEAERAAGMPSPPPAERAETPLAIEEFVTYAAQNDTEFQEILIDELTLKYQEDLRLPARDLVLDVREDYNFFFSQDNQEETATSASLSKLFPKLGTEISAEYEFAPALHGLSVSSGFTVEVSQPIAQNAFGRSTRLLGKIVGLEVDVARHQIVEAYEDYLAAILQAYLNWYEAHENVGIGESSYAENKKLLENIEARRGQKIALPIDVNKVTIQVLAKEERLLELRERYARATHAVAKAVRLGSDDALVPVRPERYYEQDISFEEEYAAFKNESRTYAILNLLEEKSTLQVERDADDLLPSIDLMVGYTVDGKTPEIVDEENRLFAGLRMVWPFPDQADRAELQVSKINRDKRALTNLNVHYRLERDIKNLYEQIKREKDLSAIAEQKIRLARDVLKDESENYTFGKASLNDYIDAVNALDNNRFNQVFHDVEYRRFVVEWLRITDRLITREEIRARHGK